MVPNLGLLTRFYGCATTGSDPPESLAGLRLDATDSASNDDARQPAEHGRMPPEERRKAFSQAVNAFLLDGGRER